MMDIHTRQHTFLPSVSGQRTRFDRLGELLTWEDCILNLQKEVQLTDTGTQTRQHIFRTSVAVNEFAFDRLGRLTDLGAQYLKLKQSSSVD